ncbi:SH3 domain protein, partial [Dictyocaulus viviparus]
RIFVQVTKPPPHPPNRSERLAKSITTKSDVESNVVSQRTDSLATNEKLDSTVVPFTDGAVVDENLFIVLSNLQASQRGDLTITEGETLRIIQTRPDGWWTAENSNGMVGLVPKTYLRKAKSTDQSKKVIEKTNETNFHTKTHLTTRPPTPPPPPHSVASNQMSTRQVRCLGDAQDLDPHLSLACHLTPRLSHSNIGFHDLYWNYNDDKLRKRRVRVSKLVRLVRLEGMPKVKSTDICLIRAALYDRSRRTGRQIVSNVHTIRAQVKNRTWTFNTRTDTTSSGVDYGDFIVRSNYNLDDVVLLIEASHFVEAQTSLEEQSLGIIIIDLITKGEISFKNRTYCEMLKAENIFDHRINSNSITSFKIVLKVLDVPEELMPFVEYVVLIS